MTPPLLLLRNIQLTFGGIPLFEGADLSVSPGERICLVGRNGSGKSTLMKIATGAVDPDDGERFLQPGSTMRFLPQEPDLDGFATTLDYVLDALEEGNDVQRARRLIAQLGLTGAENPEHLSGGEARRCALAQALAPQPDILLLDEPTNHLDLPVIEWLENELRHIRSALVLISHDRQFLETLSQTTVWINQGRTHRLERGFSSFEPWRETFLQNRKVEFHKLDRKIAAETEWLHKGVTARRKRNMGRLRALQKLRRKRRGERGPSGNVNMIASAADNSGKRVCLANNISKSYGNRQIVSDFSTLIARGDRVGIVGPNGVGKTTLLNILTGILEPDNGSIRLGKNLELEKLDQERQSLDPTDTLATALTGGGDKVTINGETRHVIGYMKDFLFTANQAQTPVNVLSGGERGRIMLARALAKPSNLLVLDEPTNDLDLETLDLLQELLAEYAGTVLLVSHDRDFLDRVVTSVIASDGDGKWTEYAGGYSDMILQRGSDLDRKTDIAATPAGKGSKAPKSRASKPQGTSKLTYRDKHTLESLPGQIEDFQQQIADNQSILADPGLFQSDPKTFENAAKGLQDAKRGLSAAEEKWLELEMLQNQLENG
ncbi:MAG: ATP-binding cassette domain-containing protein [Pseudomonadota bacterium]|nr:ATP-binding cassette domain-containing protein [Pseudomonadota bacterium]